MICSSLKYKIGKTYHIKENTKIREKGFQFCRYPCDVPKYCEHHNDCIAIIKAEGVVFEYFIGCVTNRITIVRIITETELLLDMPEKIIRIYGC